MQWHWLAEAWPALLGGLWLTLALWLASCCLGLGLAIGLAVLRQGPGWPARLAGFFCLWHRASPLLAQLYLLYYGLGTVLPPALARLDAFWYALLAFALNFAAHEAEVLCSALQAVPRQQVAAAQALGFSRAQTCLHVELPDALARARLTLLADVVTQLKATPIAFTVPVVDLMAAAKRVMAENLITYEPLILVACIYVMLGLAVTGLASTALRRLSPTPH